MTASHSHARWIAIRHRGLEYESGRLRGVLDDLYEAYGRRDFEEADDLLAVLISTILSQSTSNTNSRRAFDSLIETFGGEWHRVAEADEGELVEAIRMGGLARQKALRIQGLLRKVRAERGAYDLRHLAELPADDARAALTRFKGVGPKTAAFSLMVATGMDVFPMDTHIFRILERLDFLDGSETDTAAHRYIESLLREGEAHAAHMVLVEHGRKTCHARTPECGACPIRGRCPFPAD